MTTNGESAMSKLTKDYRESLLEDLQDPEEAAAYLTAALDEGDPAVFLLALRNVAEAKGMSTVAAQAQLNRESLYRMLSERGNPQLASLVALLDALGLRLAVTMKCSPITPPAP
jgi:probable addiction module antidote protein